MQKSKIEWCDKTWNPVTGCLHGCEYCYARGIAHRFCTQVWEADGGLHDLTERMRFDNSPGGDFDAPQYITDPYPYEFDPTFHRYRLNEPAKLKKRQNIFVCSMADLFGEWVPDEWVQAVFNACASAPQHRYLFLTKNPKRYAELIEAAPDNIWFGWTQTTPYDGKTFYMPQSFNSFMSIEPILSDFNDFDPCCEWVIIGAMTGPGSAKHQPRREWIERIVNQCRAAGVPVFLKNNLAGIWGEPLIQEFPWEG